MLLASSNNLAESCELISVRIFRQTKKFWNFKTIWIPKMAVFWVLSPCCLVQFYRRFRSACCSSPWWQQTPLKRRQTSTRLHGATTHKTAIFIFAAVRTWNLTIWIPMTVWHKTAMIQHAPVTSVRLINCQTSWHCSVGKECLILSFSNFTLVQSKNLKDSGPLTISTVFISCPT
jgi:hypothetical protein